MEIKAVGFAIAQSKPASTGVVMALTHQRLVREHQTLAAMVQIYCRDLHGGREGLCPGCRSLVDYAAARLERCVFQAGKPTCAKCPVHCYRASHREQVKIIMRYAGPRMLLRHPILALRHMVDGRRAVPALNPASAAR